VALLNFTDADLTAMLPGKIGPMRKIAVLLQNLRVQVF